MLTQEPGAAMRRRRRLLRDIGAVIVVLIAAWLVLGFVRAPGPADAAFGSAYPTYRIDQLETTTIPAVPPFFIVHVSGAIHTGERFWEPRDQLFLVEPLTGWTINLSMAEPIPTP